MSAFSGLIHEANICGDAHRIGDTMVAAERFISFIDKVGRLIPLLEIDIDENHDEVEAGELVDQLAALVEQLSGAQQSQDTIRIADLLEHEILPLLERFRNRIAA